ncbi:lysophospholipid acyltransferase family protein [Daejeonella sp.]|jgi:1-acyl-sn-glycerol-3-phosphate acyltransferase|uniref:lysophospholipid acyltransferase family protein n=1 Tax=Daejeonella sp. TaxID=2805397 RepID=UPI0037BE9B97
MLKKIIAVLFIGYSLSIFILAMLIVMPFILIISLLFKHKQAQDIIFIFLKVWAGIFSVLCFFPIRSRGYKLHNPDKAYIYVSNHNSYLDAIAVVLSISGSVKPLGKIEMVKTPLFGMIYKRVVVLIDRKDKESRARSVEELKTDLARGQSILIFPEGTMNKTESNLADFYDGAFRLAIETQTDIAPMVILNARNLLPRANPLHVKAGLTTCVFDEPVQVMGLEAEDLEDLKAKVRKRMELLIESN